jgi:hypothetical protein
LQQFKITSHYKNLNFNENLNSMCTYLSELIHKLKDDCQKKKEEINDEFENKNSEISYEYLLSLSAEDCWNLIENNLKFIQKSEKNDLYLKKINEIQICSKILREQEIANTKSMKTQIFFGFLNFLNQT